MTDAQHDLFEDLPDHESVRFESPLWQDGYVAYPKSVLYNTDLSPATRLVYGALCDCARDESRAFPGQKTLSKKLGIGERTGRDAIRDLEKAGLLKTIRRGLRKTNLYLLTDPGVSDSAGQESPRPADPAGQERQISPVPVEEETVEEETASGTAQQDPVETVWAHFDSVFPGSRGGLTASRRRLIEKGLKEKFTPADLCQAIDGLRKWRIKKRGETSLSVIFKTRPGGDALADQVEWWMSQSPRSDSSGRAIPSASPVIVAERQRDVQRGHRMGHDPEAMQKAREAEAWLKERGITTYLRKSDGYPVFVDPGDGSVVESAG